MTTVVGGSNTFGVTISTDGVQTGAFLDQINADLAASTVAGSTVHAVSWDGTGAIPTVPAGQSELVFYTGPSGANLTLPANYSGILITSGNSTVTGGGPNTEVVVGTDSTGSGSYTGGAGSVVATSGPTAVNDSAAGAHVAVASGSSVTATGNNDTVQVDGSGNTYDVTGSGSEVSIGGTQGGTDTGAVFANDPAGNVGTVSGNNDTVVLTASAGVNTVTATGSMDDLSVAGGSNVLYLDSPGSAQFAGGSSTVITNAGQESMYGGSGDATVFANQGTDLYVGGSDSTASLVFAAANGESTIIGGAEADTVYAVAGQKYIGGSGSLWFAGVGGSSTVVGGSGAETLYGAGTSNNLFYAGSGPVDYVGYEGTGTTTVVGSSSNESLYGVASNNVFEGGAGSVTAWLYGGSDTFVGGSAAPYIYAVAANPAGASSQNISLIGTAAGVSVNDWNVQEGTINAAAAGGKDTFFVNALAGSTTVVGSNAGADTLWLVNPASSARTVDVSNWEKSDSISLFGYTAGDQTALNTAISTGAVSVTLSDSTTINFITNKTT
jgi:hypothetical protein